MGRDIADVGRCPSPTSRACAGGVPSLLITGSCPVVTQDATPRPIGQRPASALELQNVRTSQGFTLIEVLIATMILSMGLLALMTGLGNCAKMVVLSKEFQKAQYVFSLGELKYPVEETDDVEKDLTVSPDSSLVEGYEFERTVDEKKLATNEVDDELYTVRTIVSWGRGENQREELVRYVRKGKKR